jgi:uncharacterized membrane protein HdeD (DUF308 family)
MNGRSAGAATGTVDEDTSALAFGSLMVLGVVTVLFSLAVLIWPGMTVRVLAFLVGVWLVLVGIGRILGAFLSGQNVGRRALSGVVGVVLLIGGVACLRELTTRVLVLAMFIALTWILSGLAELVFALQTAGPMRTWIVVFSLVSIGIGIVFLVWPDLSLAITVILTGISGLLIGAWQIVFALRLHRRGQPARRPIGVH